MKCLKFDECIRPAVEHVFAKTIFADTLEDACKVRLGIKAVTLMGEKICSNGNFEYRSKDISRPDTIELKEIIDAKKRLEDIEFRITFLREIDQSAIEKAEEQLLKERDRYNTIEAESRALAEEQRAIQKSVKDMDVSKDGPILEDLQANLVAVESKVQAIQDQMIVVESEAFAPVSYAVGVPCIRIYEEENAKRRELISEKLHKLRSSYGSLEAKLACLKHDKPSIPPEPDMDEIRTLSNEVEAHTAGVDELQQTAELAGQLHGEVVNYSEEVKKNVIGKQKEIKKVKEVVEKIKQHIEESKQAYIQKTATRDEILQKALSDDVAIPLKHGEIGSDEDLIVDFEELPEDLMNLNEDEIELAGYEYAKISIIPPEPASASIMEEHRSASEKLDECEKMTEQAYSEQREANSKYQSIRQRRINLFLDCYKSLCVQIDRRYKDLVGEQGSMYLELDNEDEPFDHQLKIFVMPAGKRYRDVSKLSGGERRMASLAITLSLQKILGTRFIVFDELDSNLDHDNCERVLDVLRKAEFQYLMISQKPSFYCISDMLIGVYKDIRESSSKVITQNLQCFQSDDMEDDEIEAAMIIESPIRSNLQLQNMSAPMALTDSEPSIPSIPLSQFSIPTPSRSRGSRNSGS